MRHDIAKWRGLEHWLKDQTQHPTLYLLPQEVELILRTPDPWVDPFPLGSFHRWHQIAQVPGLVPAHLQEYAAARVKQVRWAMLVALESAAYALHRFPFEESDHFSHERAVLILLTGADPDHPPKSITLQRLAEIIGGMWRGTALLAAVTK